MFNRALNYITSLFAAAAPTEDDGGDETPEPLSTPADEYSLEDPLLPTTTDDDDDDIDIEAPPPSTVDDEDNLENIPTLSSTRDSIGSRIIKIMRDPRCEWVIVCSLFLILFAITVFYFVVNVNGISNDPGFRLDSVMVSSFNVSKNILHETTWDTALSLNLVEGDADVRYEAPRLWLYSRDGFVSTTSPSLHYSPDGKKLILHAVFDSMQKKVEVVNLDMLMEVNTMRVVNAHVSEVEMRWLLTIDCSGLKIEFDSLNKRFGRLIDNDGDNRCKVQVCTLESYPLYEGGHKCTSSLPSSDLRNI